MAYQDAIEYLNKYLTSKTKSSANTSCNTWFSSDVDNIEALFELAKRDEENQALSNKRAEDRPDINELVKCGIRLSFLCSLNNDLLRQYEDSIPLTHVLRNRRRHQDSNFSSYELQRLSTFLETREEE